MAQAKRATRTMAVEHTIAEQKYEVVPLDAIHPHPQNVNQGDVGAIIQSIEKNGFVGACIVQRSSGNILAGKHRWIAARTSGLGTIPVIYVDVDDKTALRYMLADNRTARLGVDEPIALADLLESIRADQGTLLGTGFDDEALNDLLIELGRNVINEEDPDAQFGRADKLQEKWKVERGQVWEIGDHRMVCGDCLSPDDVAKVLAGTKPFLMVTDPPYGIELDTEWRDRAGLNKHGPAEASYMKHRVEGHTNTTVSGDTRADWSEAFELVPSLEVAYVWHASKFTREVLDGLLRIGFLHHQQIIWNKQRTVLTRTHYWFQHEPCWYVRKKNAPWYGKPGENSTIWDSPSPKFIMGASDEEKIDHPTQKPAVLMRKSIENHTSKGDVVYEPFLGSGTTMVAAQQLKRRCYGIEIEPKYCSVILERMSDMNLVPKLAER